MRQRPRFYNGGFYHLYNRGVDKRKIVLDEKDCFRFVHNLFEMNDADIVVNSVFYRKRMMQTLSSTAHSSKETDRKPRKILVDIVAYALMPNHYHLLVRQKREKGISLFAQKLGVAHAVYFNLKHERSGSLFEGRYKAKEIAEDRYLRHLVSYIHCNPIELSFSEWREQGVGSVGKTMKALQDYRWSSYRDYLGEKNFPSVLNLDLARDLGLPTGEEQYRAIRDWIEQYPQRRGLLGDVAIDQL